MSSDKYPTLKLKYDDVIPLPTEISLNGIPIPCVRGITFCTHVNNAVNLVTIELIAKVDIESPVEVNKEMITYVDGEKYKLVKMDEEKEVN